MLSEISMEAFMANVKINNMASETEPLRPGKLGNGISMICNYSK